MGSRKNKKSSKCIHYDRGYCFKGEDCNDEHPDKVCPKTNCFDDKCPFRHPNPCKYDYRCKFNAKKICLFSHVTIVSEDEKKIEEVKKQIPAVEKDNEALSKANNEPLRKVEQKYKSLENKIEILKKENELKDENISSLEMKMNDQEKSFNTRLVKLEKQMVCNENKFKCDQCKFATNSEPGLKSHVSKKHKKEEEVDKNTQ